jgi:CrcB protein
MGFPMRSLLSEAEPTMILLAVFLGGGVGSVCRYLLSSVVQSRPKAEFPLGTLVVNVAGCIVVGALAKLFLDAQPQTIARAALIVGFCGGFTTFSAFSFETFGLVSAGKPWTALVYVLASLALCVAGTSIGFALVRSRLVAS